MIGGLGSLDGPSSAPSSCSACPPLLEFDNPWIVPIGTGILLFVVIAERPAASPACCTCRARSAVTDLVDLQAAQHAAPEVPASGIAPVRLAE